MDAIGVSSVACRVDIVTSDYQQRLTAVAFEQAGHNHSGAFPRPRNRNGTQG